jgi:hypothetical protein
MRKIFIVDDNPFMTERIGGILEVKLKQRGNSSMVITEDEYIWEVEADDRLSRGDIVLADLYPAGYWVMDRPKKSVVPPPRRTWPWTPVAQNHPTRIATAVQDVIQNYMAPLVHHKNSPVVIVYTHVLTTLFNAGMADQASQIKDLLIKCVVTRPENILEKVDRVPDDDDLETVVDHVLNELDCVPIVRRRPSVDAG